MLNSIPWNFSPRTVTLLAGKREIFLDAYPWPFPFSREDAGGLFPPRAGEPGLRFFSANDIIPWHTDRAQGIRSGRGGWILLCGGAGLCGSCQHGSGNDASGGSARFFPGRAFRRSARKRGLQDPEGAVLV